MINVILKLMEENHVTAKQLTGDLGLSGSAISEWKKGKGKPSTDAVVKIARYFGVSTDYILGVEDIKKEKPTPEDGSGLTEEQMEIVRLFESAPAALRTAALAVLRSAEGQGKVPDGASEAE